MNIDLTICTTTRFALQSAPHRAALTLRTSPCLPGATPEISVLACGPSLKPMYWNITHWKARSLHQPAEIRERSYINQLDSKHLYNFKNTIIFCSKRCRDKKFLTCRLIVWIKYYFSLGNTKRKINYILMFTQPLMIALFFLSCLILLHLFMKHNLLIAFVSVFLFSHTLNIQWPPVLVFITAITYLLKKEFHLKVGYQLKFLPNNMFFTVQSIKVKKKCALKCGSPKWNN